MEALVEKVEQPINNSERGAGIVRGEGVGAQQHGGAHDILGERLAKPGGVRLDDEFLIKRHIGNHHPLILEEANAGVEGIHQRGVVMEPVGFNEGAGVAQRFA